jgi:hypothetical protein
LKAWAVETTRFGSGGGERKNQGSCIYGPYIFLEILRPLQIKEDNRFKEISEQKIIYSKTRGMC